VSVILSNAKDLGRDSSRRYAAFRMTGQMEVVILTGADAMQQHRCGERPFIPSLLRRSARGLIAECLFAAAMLLGFGGQAVAQELIVLEYPFPSSVEEDVTPIEVSFSERVFPAPMFDSVSGPERHPQRIPRNL
jgi:hypothetical protein